MRINHQKNYSRNFSQLSLFLDLPQSSSMILEPIEGFGQERYRLSLRLPNMFSLSRLTTFSLGFNPLYQHFNMLK